MLVEGRIETTNWEEIFGLQVPFGLDTCTCMICQANHASVRQESTAYSTNELLL